MKKIGQLLLVALLGAGVTLGAYKAFWEEPQVRTIIEQAPAPVRQVAQVKGAPADKVSFVQAAEKTVNSVVHVKTATRAQQPQSPLEYFFGMPQNPHRGRGRGRLRMGSGSGVIISPDGFIVTNNHVIERAEEIQVVLNNEDEYEAEIVGRDPTTDIALLKIEAEELPYLEFSNSDKIRVGEWVLAVGNPFNLTSTVTAGIVSATGRNIGIIDKRTAIESFIQTDAAVNPGNSGGALVNTQGQLVGINSAISSQTGTYEGYAFAVPSNIAQKVVEDLKEYGTVQRGFIGVSISDISARMEEELELPSTKGVYVAGLTENGAAAEAGLEKGDVIIAVGPKKVTKSSELQELIGSKRPGDKVSVTVRRDGETYTYELVLRNAQGTTDLVKKEDKAFVNLLGGQFRPITKEEAQLYGLAYGVKITGVKEGILSEQQIPEGYIITSINQNPIRDVDDINAAARRLREEEPVVIFGVLPNGREKYFAFDV